MSEPRFPRKPVYIRFLRQFDFLQAGDVSIVNQKDARMLERAGIAERYTPTTPQPPTESESAK